MTPFQLDFIGLGAAKAGTTWIGACFAEHPEICMSDPKELNFFGHRHVWPPSPTHYHKGLSWLERQFHHRQQGQRIGEYSVGYLIDPQSAELIAKHMPQAKLIVSLRNPIDALYSFYWELVKQYPVPSTFEKLLETWPDFITYGDYLQHLQPFLQHFPPEQLKIILYDDIRQDPATVLRQLYAYIGADPDFQPPSLTTRVNERREPKYRWVRNAIGGTRDFLRQRPALKPLTETLRILGAEKFANWAIKRNQVKTQQPPMQQTTREHLRQRYTPGNQTLANFLQRDLAHWT